MNSVLGVKTKGYPSFWSSSHAACLFPYNLTLASVLGQYGDNQPCLYVRDPCKTGLISDITSLSFKLPCCFCFIVLSSFYHLH